MLLQRGGRCSAAAGRASARAAAAAAAPRAALLAAAARPLRHARTCAVAVRAQQRLVVYTKPDCPLCDGLKERIEALIARAAFAPSSPLAGATLEARDISSNAAWQDEMHLSVPVLAALTPAGDEVRVCARR